MKQRTIIEAGDMPNLVAVTRQELCPYPYPLGAMLKVGRWRAVRGAITRGDYLCDTERLATFIEYMDGTPPECAR